MRRIFTKSCLLGLLSLLCAAPATLAQYPAVGPEPGAPQLYSTPARGVVTLPDGTKVDTNPPWSPNPAPHSGGVVVGGPLGPQPTGHHVHGEECMRVPSTDKKVKVEYGSVAIDYCLPSCRHGGCGDGDCGCGQPRRKHFLMKREVTCERPAYDCTPSCAPHMPVWAPAPCGAAGGSPVFSQPTRFSTPYQPIMPRAEYDAPPTMMGTPEPGMARTTTIPVTDEWPASTPPIAASFGPPH